MKIINGDAPFNRKYIRIDKDGEFEKCIEEVVNAGTWDLPDKSYSSLVLHHRIKGSRIQPSIPYPYVMVVEVDDVHEVIIIDFITKSMFEQEDSNEKAE
jgi:hypothetical protein